MKEKKEKRTEEAAKAQKFVKYKNVTEQISTSLVFYVATLLMDFVLILCVTGKFPTFIWFGLAIIHLITMIIFVMPTQTARKIIAILFLTIQLAICVTNDILFHVTGEIFTFDKLLLASEGIGTFDPSLINGWHIFFYGIIYIPAIVAMFIVPKYVKKWKPKIPHFWLVFAIYACSFLTCFTSAAIGWPKENALWKGQYPSAQAYNRYGYYGFYTPNMFRFIGELLVDKKLTEEQKAEYLSYLEDGETTETTAFSGISKDNNLIVILAESLDVAAIDQYFTPNLYELFFEDGMYLENYHSENKTNMSEGMVMFGTYSHRKALTTNIDMAEILNYVSLPHLLEQQAEQNGEEIKTGYYHALAERFYSRNVTFNNIGFDSLTFADQQEEELRAWIRENSDNYNWRAWFHDFVRDSDFFEYNKEEMIPDEGRFFTYYTTLVTHGPYKERGSNQKYYDRLTSDAEAANVETMLDDMEAEGLLPRSVLDKFLLYKAAVMDFDIMIGEMKARLIETGNLENTTIVIFPDHNAYFSDVSFNLRGIYGTDVRNCNVKAYNIGACIYDQKLIAAYKGETTYTGGVVVDKFVSVNDLYPTICDLFDLPYNTSICYGKNIFIDDPRVMLSLKDDGYIFDDKFYYALGEFYSVDPNETSSDAYFRELIEDILYKFSVQENLYAEKKLLLSYLKRTPE